MVNFVFILKLNASLFLPVWIWIRIRNTEPQSCCYTYRSKFQSGFYSTTLLIWPGGEEWQRVVRTRGGRVHNVPETPELDQYQELLRTDHALKELKLQAGGRWDVAGLETRAQ